MKIPSALITLTKEHHLSLSLANQAVNAITQNNITKINVICQKITQNFQSDFVQHFAFEEQNILPLLQKKYPQDCYRIIEEHKKLLFLADNITQNNLLEFSALLKVHTRFEDRELFKKLTTQDLAILQQNL